MQCRNQAFPKRGQSAVVATEGLSVLLTAIPPKGTHFLFILVTYMEVELLVSRYSFDCLDIY